MSRHFVLPVIALALAGPAGAVDWPLREPFAVMNTVSTLQFYGPKPGFHHGADLKTRAGAKVYAPVEGKVGMGYYYPPRQTPYTYMVFIDAVDGFRWEFHHVDQNSITPELRALAARGGSVKAGTYLAEVYDAPLTDPRIAPHVHVDVIDRAGVHHNPLKFFPRLADDQSPVVNALYLVDKDNRALAGDRLDFRISEVVADVIDFIPGSPLGDTVKRLELRAGEIVVKIIDFDRLPEKDYLKGVADVYKIEPIRLPDGSELTNQVELDRPRKFLYRFPFDGAMVPTGTKTLVLTLEVLDFYGNRSVFTSRLSAGQSPNL